MLTSRGECVKARDAASVRRNVDRPDWGAPDDRDVPARPGEVEQPRRLLLAARVVEQAERVRAALRGPPSSTGRPRASARAGSGGSQTGFVRTTPRVRREVVASTSVRPVVGASGMAGDASGSASSSAARSYGGSSRSVGASDRPGPASIGAGTAPDT